MIRDYCRRFVGWLTRGASAEDTGAERDNHDEPTITAQTMRDSSDQILVFRVPDEMPDEDAAEFIEYIKGMRDSGGLQSSILIVHDRVDMSAVVDQ